MSFEAGRDNVGGREEGRKEGEVEREILIRLVVHKGLRCARMSQFFSPYCFYVDFAMAISCASGHSFSRAPLYENVRESSCCGFPSWVTVRTFERERERERLGTQMNSSNIAGMLLVPPFLHPTYRYAGSGDYVSFCAVVCGRDTSFWYGMIAG